MTNSQLHSLMAQYVRETDEAKAANILAQINHIMAKLGQLI